MRARARAWFNCWLGTRNAVFVPCIPLLFCFKFWLNLKKKNVSLCLLHLLEREGGGQTDRQTERLIERQGERDRKKKTDTERENTERERDRQTDKQTETETETQRETNRQTDRQRKKETD